MLTWLPKVLKDAGIKTLVLPGAEYRGRPTITVKGVVWHHTATGPNWTDAAVAKLLRDGRSDLAGPLSQVGIQRDGTWVIVALGRANHNGYGTWGNDSLGLEFYNDGKGERYPAIQIESGINGTVAVLKHLRLAATQVLGHKETDPKRKIDPLFDMRPIRAAITTKLAGSPAPIPTPEDEVPDVIIFFTDGGAGNHAYRCTGVTGKYLPTAATIQALQFIGIKTANKPGDPWNLDIAKGYALLDGPLKNIS